MVDHSEVQAALSARLDGEPHELADEIVDAHVAGCEECRAFWDKSVSLSRRLSFVEGRDGMSPPADLSEVIIAGVEPEWRRRAAGQRASVAGARVLVGIVGVVLVLWAVVKVIQTGGLAPASGDGDILAPYAQPEYAALIVEAATLRLGVGVGLLCVAWQPDMAKGALPIVATIWAFLLGFGIRDVLLGIASMENIVLLTLLLLSVIALTWVWLASRGTSLRHAWRALMAQPI